MADLTPSEIRDQMLVILDGGNAWTSGANARDENAVYCSILSERAVAWDIYGALVKVTFNQESYAGRHVMISEMAKAIPQTSDFKSRDIERYNDLLDWAGVESFLTGLDL